MSAALTSQPVESSGSRIGGDPRWTSSSPGIHNDTVVHRFPGNDDATITVEAINYLAHGIIANIVVGIGIIGNILNLIVLTRPKLKGVMYVYLLGLAVSNLCVLILAIPALMDIVDALTSKSYATAFFQAHLEMPFLNSFMASSVYIIICMTVNRYISIYKPTHFQRIHTFKNAYLAIAFSFLGGMVLHIPLAFEKEVVPLGGNNSQYGTAPNDVIANHFLFRIYLWLSESLLRLGPIITLTILNILIIVRFQRIALRREELRGNNGHRGSNAPPSPYSTTNGPASTSCGNRLSVTQINGKLAVHSVVVSEGNDISRAATPAPPNSNNESPSKSFLQRGTPSRSSSRRRGLHNPEERMLVVVLIAIVILFVVCTTPAAFLSILVTEELKKKVWFAIFRACANNLELLCFALNFFVYCLCSADIRKAFVDVLFENGVVLYLRRKSFSSSTNGGGGGIELTNVGAQNV